MMPNHYRTSSVQRKKERKKKRNKEINKERDTPSVEINKEQKQSKINGNSLKLKP